MTPDIADRVIQSFTHELRNRLDAAMKAAQAADACLDAGLADQAVNVLRDVEQPIYEATTLLNAVSLVPRSRSA
ncbi:hypothetical protein GJW-30_1_01964 [Variibacter gotjawalensis]|uniref:Uncharacterized protein n=1 Tax=Variibacter gotjawalensis TaxID=1333996 RepID=A0A0S3PU14_9BRAD|nr:hypothetical protein [Variibacter gotjawalensis]NIK49753.1 flagellar hook-basal body complex protein FliE [Variibacter gotjawalensis]RZS45758.1 hypothetical protein EV661_4082 [Variibacter gotjawalensis]BAT59431.1 hypothetical protein GJW-30_1_01964 [Variibacter gotjawalensis]